jgi:hypothetical protein
MYPPCLFLHDLALRDRLNIVLTTVEGGVGKIPPVQLCATNVTFFAVASVDHETFPELGNVLANGIRGDVRFLLG